MNLTDGPYFPSPAHPSLTDGFRKKAEAAAWAGKIESFQAPGNLSVRKGQGQAPRTSKWRKVFGVNKEIIFL